MIKQRLHTFDLISGYFILWMVFFHASQWCKSPISSFYNFGIYTVFFFMPWFFFKAGYLVTKRSFGQSIKHLLTNLVSPFLIWSLFGISLVLFSLVVLRNWSVFNSVLFAVSSFWQTGAILGNPPLWFAYALILCQFALPFLNSHRFLFLVLPVIGYFFNFYQVQLVLGLTPFFISSFFFILGLRFQEIHFKYPRTTFSLLLSFGVIIQFLNPSLLDIKTNTLDYGNYIAFVMSSSFILISILFLPRKLKLIPLNWIGERTSVIFFAHWPTFLFLDKFRETFPSLISDKVLLPVYFLTSVLVPILVSLVLPPKISIRQTSIRLY